MSDYRVTHLRVEIDRWNVILSDDDQPPHNRALAGRRIAELQLELQALTGDPPSITMADVERYESAVRAAQERVRTGQVPQFGHQANVSGEFRRRELPQETQLVGDPTERALRERRIRRAEMAATPPAAASYGKPADAWIPNPVARPTGNLTDNGPVYTRRASLSGKTQF
jgi:hypothetical protein